MRGTSRTTSIHLDLGRFIPACAGNIIDPSPLPIRAAVHPRVCGEHAPPAAILAALAVHPRVCGEHLSRQATSKRLFGSSPRVRGTLEAVVDAQLPSRFIPACAGNIPAIRPFAFGRPVHPRVCGEHFEAAFSKSVTTGSSPRVRGTLKNIGSPVPMNRFIPACAGNIVSAWICRHSYPVHPRVCGEHGFDVEDIDMIVGSSPRVRGTLPQSAVCGFGWRFIPACAGNIVPGRPYCRA